MDDSLCGQEQNTIVSPKNGACCYLATIDNVNLLTGEVTVTFSDGAPDILGEATQAIISSVNVRYNCGLCYTNGLAVNTPALAYEYGDEVIILVAGENLALVGHNYDAVEDLKVCGMMGFMPLWPSADVASMGYGNPFIEESVDAEGNRVCTLVSPFYDPFLEMNVSRGTLGSTPYNLIMFGGTSGVFQPLRPYSIPSGGSFSGYPDPSYQIDRSRFDVGVQIVAKTAYAVAPPYFWPSVTWDIQDSRSIGTGATLGGGANFNTGSLFSFLDLNTFGLMELFLIDSVSGDVWVLDADNGHRKYHQQWDSVARSIGYDGTYTLDPFPTYTSTYGYASYGMTIQSSNGISSHVCTSGTVERTSSYGPYELMAWGTDQCGLVINVTQAESSITTDSLKYTGSLVGTASWDDIDNEVIATYSKSLVLNGTTLGLVGFAYEYNSLMERVLANPADDFLCSDKIIACSAPYTGYNDAPSAGWIAATTGEYTGSGSMAVDDIIFLHISPTRDFAVYVTIHSEAVYSGTGAVSSMDGLNQPAEPVVANSGNNRTISAALKVYSSGNIKTLETKTYTVPDTTSNGAFVFENFGDVSQAVPPSYSPSLNTVCSYGTVPVAPFYLHTESSGSYSTTEDVSFFYVLSDTTTPLYTTDYQQVPLLNAYDIGLDSEVRHIIIASDSGALLFDEFSISDDGSIVYFIMPDLDNTGVHKILIVNGVIQEDATDVLDAATGLTWDAVTLRYAPLT